MDFPGGEPPADLEITDLREGGGRRAGAGNVIKPGETLIFVCDLVSA